MLKKLFGTNKNKSEPTASNTPVCEWMEEGLLFHRQLVIQQNKPLDGYLYQLEDEGYLTSLSDDAIVMWDDLYRLINDEEHLSSIPLLDLPPVWNLAPQLISEGALSDPEFRISIQGWRLNEHNLITGGLNRTGALVRIDGQEGLMPDACWRVLQAVRELAVKQNSESGERTNQLGWAKVRKLAKAAGAGMDGFLAKSVVLHPDKLKIEMRKAHHGGVPIMELLPGFDGQPEKWLDSFDAYQQVQERYHIIEHDGSVVHVIMSPESKTVLESIKRMPGRRVAGDEALQWVRNPYSVMGAETVAIIDPDEFEQARANAGIFFHRFHIEPSFNAAGQISHVDLVLEEICPTPAPATSLRFTDAHEFHPFAIELQAKMAAGLACGFWQGYELELSDFRHEDLAGILRLLDRWQQEAMGRMFEELFDMSNYGDRVTGIGPIETPSSPFIGKDGGEQWLPPELLASCGLDADLLNHWDTANYADFQQFCERIEQAKAIDNSSVHIPTIEVEVSLKVAETLRDEWAKKFELSAPSGKEENKLRAGLLVDSGIQNSVDTTADVRLFSESTKAVLPSSLRPEMTLRPHQMHGLAWLQHLYAQVPNKVTGCLLADDMGLGKTLQLLCFIAWYLEHSGNNTSRPVLIVAPVSLLDNWEREFDRFFHTHGMPMLKLYGFELSEMKLKRNEIPITMQEQGIRNLLRPGWIGSTKIVLTTYETLRDQELSLARQKWGIVICDEAQKIKNPATLVTQAAKALQADFRVACTGTPVENSLTDLWCLFDFVQPGLLGALNDFGRHYRRPIECKTDADNLALEELRQLIAPQLLRRMKEDVAELPAKIEDTSCRSLTMSSLQDRLYRSEITLYMEKSSLIEKAGERNVAVLGLLHTLKLVCAHPHAIRPEGALLDVSPKMRWLINKLEYIQSLGEKVIVFTELRSIQRDLRLTIMERFSLPDVHIINGDTAATAGRGLNRQGIIDKFQAQPGFGVIILSTSAVGFGVNVQAANHVIHFTRSWNPAKEDQATDRAYRIGQTREVHVYYPTVVSEHYATFENKLDDLLSRKRAVAGDMLNGAEEVDVLALAESGC